MEDVGILIGAGVVSGAGVGFFVGNAPTTGPRNVIVFEEVWIWVMEIQREFIVGRAHGRDGSIFLVSVARKREVPDASGTGEWGSEFTE